MKRMSLAPKKFVLFLECGPPRFTFMELYEFGFVVKWIHSLTKAETELHRCLYDVLFVELRAGVFTVNNVCARIRAFKPKLRIVFLKDPAVELPERHCGDVVLDSNASREELLAEIR